MAWLLGYIWADGNIEYHTTTLKNYCLSFVSCDRQLIELVKELLNSHHKISFRKNVFILKISSKPIVMDLIREFGLCPAKSLKDLDFPDVSDSFLCHFVRGYIDGDGCICIGKKDYVQIEIMGSKKFITGMQKAICKNAEVPGYLVRRHHKTNTWIISWGAKKVVEKLYRWLYPCDDVICLNRKRKILDEFYKVGK